MALTLGPGPQASTARGSSPKIAWATGRVRDRPPTWRSRRPGSGTRRSRRRPCAIGLDHVEEGDGIGLDAVGRARQQQAEQLRLVRPVEQPPAAAGASPRYRSMRPRRPGGRASARDDHGWVARKIGGRSGSVYPRYPPLVRARQRRPASSLSIWSIDLPLVSMPKK